MTDIPLTYRATDQTRPASQSAQRNVQAVGKAATAANKELQSAASGMRGALKGVGGEIGGITGSIPQFNSGMLAMTGLIGGVAVGAVAAGKALFEMAGEARAFNVIKGSFNDLAASAGADSNSMLKSLQAASRGMISQAELVQSANRAMLLGVADTEEEMGQLMEVAIARGRAMGLSATQAFNDLVTGLGRMSPMILDNLGIVTGGEKVFDEYAASVGKATDALTDAERKTALFNKVMSTSADIVASSRDANVDAAQTAGAAWADFRVVLGTLADPIVTAGLQALTGALKGVADAVAPDEAPTLGEYGDEIDGLRAKIKDLKALGQTEDDLTIVNLRAQISGLQAMQSALDQRLETEKKINDWQKANWTDTSALEAQANALRAQIAPIEALLNNPNAKLADWEIAGQTRQLEDFKAQLEGVEGAIAGANAQIQEGGYAWQAYAASVQPAIQAEKDLALQQQTQAAVSKALAEEAAVNSAQTIAIIQATYAQAADLTNEQISRLDEAARTMFDHLVENGYTAAQAMEIVTASIKRSAEAMREQNEALAAAVVGVGELAAALPSLADWLGIAGTAAANTNVQLLQLAGTAAGVALGIGSIGDVPGGRANRGGGREKRVPTQEQRQIANSHIYVPTPARIGPYGKAGKDPFAGLGGVYDDLHDLGSAAGGAAKALEDIAPNLESALRAVPGLFGASQVTQEQLDAAARGEPQNFADNYLRRLRDEVQNGVDWEGVSVEDAAKALGIDGGMAAEEVLKQFEAAWQNQSLFANPANLKFIDMAAVQASIEQQTKEADGAKNLKALFGIGDEKDVEAIAALGLDIQTGLSDWLTKNGFTDAGTALASALGAGVAEGSAELGAGVSGGLNSWATSKGGQQEIQDFADRLSEYIGAKMKIKPNMELPDGPPPAGAGGVGGAAGGSPAYDAGGPSDPATHKSGYYAEAVHVVNVASPVDMARAGAEIARRMKGAK